MAPGFLQLPGIQETKETVIDMEVLDMPDGYKPRLTHVSYDGGKLHAEWDANIPPRFTGFMVYVKEEGGSTNEYPSQESVWEKDLQLSPHLTYKLWVVIMVSEHPTYPGDEITLITTSPQVYSVTYDGSQLQLYWNAAGGAGVEGYVATLEELGKNTWNEYTDELSTQFDQVLKVTEEYSVVVRAYNSNRIVLGPASAIYTPIVAAPVMTSVYYDSETLTLTWTAAPGGGVQAYIATLEEVGKKKRIQSTEELTAEFDQELQTTGDYKVYVQAADETAVVFGPPSEILVPLVTSPGNLRVNYTGTELVAQWAADINPLTTAYLIQLYKDDIQLEQQSLDTTTTNFEYQLDNGSVYKARVRSTGNKVQGPWTVWALAPYAAIVNYEYDKLCRIKTITWNQRNILTFNMDDPGNILSLEYSESSE